MRKYQQHIKPVNAQLGKRLQSAVDLQELKRRGSLSSTVTKQTSF